MTSIIIPVFNEQHNIQPLYLELTKVLDSSAEIIFTDDGSTDATFLHIQQLSQQDSRVKCISLSRNFGHQNALMAGMQHAKGDCIIIMDGDLQHPPAMIPEMLKQLSNGFDIVNTRRTSTAEISIIKRLFTGIFYKMINAISDTSIEANVADFRAFNKKVLGSILQIKERELFLRGIFSWVGYNTITLDFTAPSRKFGSTKYSFIKMVRLALKGTTSFSFKPLRLALLIGSFISMAAFAFSVFAFVSYMKGNTVPGWASIIIAVMFLGGTQLLAIGLLGEYIASLFTESKQRPLYLINHKINID